MEAIRIRLHLVLPGLCLLILAGVGVGA